MSSRCRPRQCSHMTRRTHRFRPAVHGVRSSNMSLGGHSVPPRMTAAGRPSGCRTFARPDPPSRAIMLFRTTGVLATLRQIARQGLTPRELGAVNTLASHRLSSRGRRCQAAGADGDSAIAQLTRASLAQLQRGSWPNAGEVDTNGQRAGCSLCSRPPCQTLGCSDTRRVVWLSFRPPWCPAPAPDGSTPAARDPSPARSRCSASTSRRHSIR